MGGLHPVTGAFAQQAPSMLGASWWDRLWFRGETGISTFSDGTDGVFFYIFWVSAFFFVLLMGLMVYFAFKYRRIPGKAPEPSPAHNTALELAWSVIPLLLMVVMFIWGAKEYIDMRVAPSDAELISVTARQWGWDWEYDNGGTARQTEVLADTESPVFALPVGRPVRFMMHSQDVIHSMYLSAFRAKTDVFPNRYTTMWVQARPGTATHRFVKLKDNEYELQRLDEGNPGLLLACTEYCGDQHSQMWARIVLLDDVDYRAWKAYLKDTSGVPLVELGEMLHKTKGCVSCHSVDGSSKTGPTWLGIWGEERPAWNTKANTGEDGYPGRVGPNYIRESLLEPAVYVRPPFPNQMQTFQGKLTDREIRALIVYIQSLSNNAEDKAAAMAESEREIAEQQQPGESEGGAEGADGAAPEDGARESGSTESGGGEGAGGHP